MENPVVQSLGDWLTMQHDRRHNEVNCHGDLFQVLRTAPSLSGVFLLSGSAFAFNSRNFCEI